MEFKEIVLKRYATKSFDGTEIPEAKISELMELIRYSASSFGLQPYMIKVISDKETKEKLLPLSWNQTQITNCSHLFVFCADTNIIPRIERLQEMMIHNGAKAESIKGYVDMMRGFETQMPEDKKVIWAQKQAYIALGNAINGAKALGFDSCPMEGFDASGYAKILDLPKNLVPTVVCPVGYASDKPKPKIRFSEKELFF